MEKVSVMPMGYILANTVMEDRDGGYSVEMEAAEVTAPIYYKPASASEKAVIDYLEFNGMFKKIPLAQRYAIDQIVGNFFWKQIR